MKIFNLNSDPEWDRTEDREGWRIKDAWVGYHVGAELIGGSMYEVEPGEKQGPYHTHHANEEWVIVLRGEPTLRTHEGEQVLREGDVVAFPRGKEGAHQIRNDTDAPIRVLMLSTLIAPDIVEYLDTGKIGARSVAGDRIMFARPGPELEYWEDEELLRGATLDQPGSRDFAPTRRHPSDRACRSDIHLTHVREASVHRGFRATSDDASRMSSMRSVETELAALCAR